MTWVVGPVLGLETSGRLTGAALVTDGRLLAESAVDIGAGRDELLLALVRDLLDRHGFALSDLSRIGVALGPGSFTGIRVGLAAAQTLAFGSGVSLVGVPSHQALALPLAGLDGTLVLLTGMRKGQIFAEAGRWEELSWRVLVPGTSVPVDRLREHLAPVWPAEAGRLLFLGEAVESARERVPELFSGGDRMGSGLAIQRRPGPIALLAARAEALTVASTDAASLEPLYLRAADARKPTRP